MVSKDTFSIYQRFGNMFPLKCEKGAVYEVSRNPETQYEEDAMVYWKGLYFTFLPELSLSKKIDPPLELIKSFIKKQFPLALKRKGYKFQMECCYHPTDEAQQTQKDIFSMFRGFKFRLLSLDEDLLLCIDPHLVIVVNATIEYLAKKYENLNEINDFSVKWNLGTGENIDGYLIKRKYTLGLTASPQREDQREELIFSLTGKPCLVGSTLIKDVSGLWLPLATYNSPSTISTNSMKFHERACRLVPAEWAGRAALKISTLGKSVVATEDHPFLVWRDEKRAPCAPSPWSRAG